MVINIAEGSGKSSSRDKKNYFTIARASAYECISLLEILIDLGVIANKGISSILSEFDEVSKMLYALINSQRTR
ncbi:MAG: four helix bundle protein [bacterium]